MTRWFGRDYGSPMQKDCPQIATPVGAYCFYCEESIVNGDDGIIDSGGNVLHYACFMRGLIGSINHQLGMCSCFHAGAVEVDELGTKRQAAEAALRFYEYSRRTKREVRKCIQ
jgi:hypothetical protein